MVPQIFIQKNTCVRRGLKHIIQWDYESYTGHSIYSISLQICPSSGQSCLSVSYRKGAALIKICRSLIDECLWLLSKA